MTPREAERRLHLLEGTVLARYPDHAPPATEIERWAAESLSVGDLMRLERLFRVWADDPERDDRPITDFERALAECACLDAPTDDPDAVRRSYLASCPHDPSDPEMAEARDWIARWVLDPDRAFMRGADVRGYLAWHGIVIEDLSAGELTRLTAVLKVFEDHPTEAATLQPDAIGAVVGRVGGAARWRA